MEIKIQIKNLPEVVERLKAIPNGAKFALQHAILDALRKGRTEGARAATARYMVPYGQILKAEGTPKMVGLTGFLIVSGSKFPLSMFPHSDLNPKGSTVKELRGGSRMTLRHAFGAKVMERQGKGAPRYPIHAMVGLSAPEMMGPDGRQTEVFAKMEKSMQTTLDTRLEHYISQILGGGIKV